MSKELVCPFCNQKLEPIGTSGQFQCGTWGCDASFNFYATRDVWEYIDRTRKALETLQEFITKLYLNGNITDEQLERYKKMLITALEQKD